MKTSARKGQYHLNKHSVCVETSARKGRDEADGGEPRPYESSTHLLMLVVPMCRRWPCAIAALAAAIPYWG